MGFLHFQVSSEEASVPQCPGCGQHSVSRRQRPALQGPHKEVSGQDAAFVPGWVPRCQPWQILVAHSLMSFNKTCNLQACFAG